MGRKNNIDLLRIICMYFVVNIHVLGHSGFLEAVGPTDIGKYILANVLSCFIRVAVPIFVLITGYFGINFSRKKLIGMEITLYFYSFFTLGVQVLFGQFQFDVLGVLKTIMPFSYKSWWFATAYMVLMIFAPYVNRLMENITRKEHLSLLVACFILFNLISSFSLDPIDVTGGYSFINFVFLYMVGHYIKKYQPFENVSKYIWLMGYSIASLLIFVSYVLYGNYKFGTYNSVLLFVAAVSLFMFFININVSFPIVSKVSPYVFAVYLISDSFRLRKIVNQTIFDPNTVESAFVLIYILLYSLVILIICICIDVVRVKLFGKIHNNLVLYIDESYLKLKKLVIKKLKIMGEE